MKKGRKGLVSHAGGCQGCLPEETQISSLSRIRKEQKFISVWQTAWHQVATMTLRTGSVVLCLSASSQGFTLFFVEAENCSEVGWRLLKCSLFSHPFHHLEMEALRDRVNKIVTETCDWIYSFPEFYSQLQQSCRVQPGRFAAWTLMLSHKEALKTRFNVPAVTVFKAVAQHSSC